MRAIEVPRITDTAVERVLLVLNTASGTGRGNACAHALARVLAQHHCDSALAIVDDHRSARELVSAFLSDSDRPTLIVAGGGGGTLRAVIEGAFACERAYDTRFAALRMGSGNVLARALGASRDPVQTLQAILINAQAGSVRRYALMRCDNGAHNILYATTLAGFGVLGRVPADLTRWHRRLPTLRRLLAGFIGIEKLNSYEYLSAFFARAILTNGAEAVEINAHARRARMRLLAAVVMKLPVTELPYQTSIRVEDEALELLAIPYEGRPALLRALVEPNRLLAQAVRWKIVKGEQLEIALTDRAQAQFFLDEDSECLNGRVTIEPVGPLQFVPAERAPLDQEVSL